MSQKKILIIISGLALALSGIFYLFKVNQNAVADPRVNQIFKMRDIYNIPVAKLSTDFIIINFWASWCPPCVEETTSLVRFTEKYSQYFTLIALSQDTEKKDIESFIKVFPALKSRYITIIHDDNQSSARLFKVGGLPETFVYSVKQNKFYKITGATDWDHPDLIKNLERHFKFHF